MSRPGRPLPDSEENPYRALVVAILERAVLDATGRCDPTRGQERGRLQAEAQAWLANEAAVGWLLELGGYASAPVLARLRQWQEAHSAFSPKESKSV